MGIFVGNRGTSQKWKDGKLDVGKYVATFMVFFPADNPKYLALVIIDEPQGSYYGSTVAAPYAKQVFEGIISLKNLKPSLTATALLLYVFLI